MSIHSNASAIQAVPFKVWTGARRIDTFGTTAGCEPIAFERWRNFKEAFAPEIVEKAITETPGKVEHVLDPFGGVGTSALATQFLGAKPTTIEVNPYLADLIEAKLSVYDLDQVGRTLARICTSVIKTSKAEKRRFAAAPKTFVEPGVNGRYIFSKSIASRIFAFRSVIEEIPCPKTRRLFRVLLGAILVSVSNVVISGKGRRYRRSWEKRSILPTRVDELFQELALQAIYDLRLFQQRACNEFKILRGDSRELVKTVEPIDLAVFSPPYPNSFDYTDVYNLELWALGYLTSKQSNWDLRKATLRSHVQIKRDMTALPYEKHSAALRRSLKALSRVRSNLWNRQIPEMVAAYISDMAGVLLDISQKLRAHGRIYMVVGDSRYAGISVPVAEILEEIAPALGLGVIASESCRSMRTSPQQGGQEELPETLLVLQK